MNEWNSPLVTDLEIMILNIQIAPVHGTFQINLKLIPTIVQSWELLFNEIKFFFHIFSIDILKTFDVECPVISCDNSRCNLIMIDWVCKGF